MTEFQLQICSSNSATSTAQLVACFINIQLDLSYVLDFAEVNCYYHKRWFAVSCRVSRIQK